MIKKFFSIIVLILLITSVVSMVGSGSRKKMASERENESAALADDPWPSSGHDERNTGLSEFELSKNQGEILWNYSVGVNLGYLHSSPVINSNDTIFFGVGSEELTAVDDSGSFLWNKSFNDTIGSIVLRDDGNLYVRCFDRLYMINTYKRSIGWRYDLKKGSITNPLTLDDDGNVYFGNQYGELVSVSREGERRWKYNTGKYIESTPTIDGNGVVYVGSNNDNIYAIKKDGILKWKKDLQGDVKTTLYHEGSVYVGTFEDYFFSLNAETGSIQWRYNTDSYIYESPSLGPDGTIYLSTYDGVMAFTEDGDKIWSYDLTSGGPSPVIGSQGTIIAFTASLMNADQNKIYAINSDGSEKWTLSTEGNDVFSSGAVDSRGRIFVTSNTGNLYCIGTSEDEENPTLKADAGEDREVEVGEEITLDASNSSADNDIVSYEWDLSNGESEAGENITYTYEESGDYTVKLNVTDKEGNSDTDTITITVNEERDTDSDQTDETGDDNGMPGFTLMVLIIGVFLAVIYRKKTNPK
ncbi:MAG: PQQ-binding-like beta-propeller repeat protein [Thermoplasmatota archaeon]